MKNKNYYINSAIFLFFALICFSVAIPYSESKINAIEADRELYTKNVINGIAYGNIKTISIDIYNALGEFLNYAKAPDEDTKKALTKIRDLYYSRAQEAYGGQIFLEKHPPSGPLPSESDLIELQKKSIEELDKIRQSLSFEDWNKNYKSNISKWVFTKNIFLFFAVFFQLIGIWFGIKANENKDSELIKENRTLIQRVNILIKKQNKNT